MTEAHDSAPISEGIAPAQRISVPEYIDWHMIFDYELEQLSQLETGIVGSIGFVALGAALGSAGQFCDAIDKISREVPVPLSLADLVYVSIFIGSLVAAVICLTMFAVSRHRNSGLVTNIRKRKRHNWPSSSAT